MSAAPHDDPSPNLSDPGKLPAPRADNPAGGQVPVAGASGRARLPDAPARDKRPARKPIVVKRPALVVRPPPTQPDAPAPAPPKKEARTLSKSQDESKRLFTAAGIGARQGVARVSWSDQLVFRCPVCEQQLQCADSYIGKSFVCDSCDAELGIPVPESGEKIELIRSGGPRTDGMPILAGELPEGRGGDGPAGKVSYQSIDSLLPDDAEGTHEWGLEKATVLADAPRRSRSWVWIAAVVLVSALGFLTYQAPRSAGRSSSAAAVKGETMTGPAIRKLDLAAATPLARYMMADTTIRAYLQAEDLQAKAKFSRDGDRQLARMTAYYQRKGGYEAEPRAYGDITTVVLGEQRTVQGENFQLVKVNFAKGKSGVYVLACGADGYLVDWEYAVGFSDVTIDELVEGKPVQPVLMRVYLEEGAFFEGGFSRDVYRQFDMCDADNERVVSVFVARGSAVEAAIREAYREEVVRSLSINGTKGEKKLDFTVRVRHENAHGHGGFVIDEVLARGWILPDPK